MSRIRASVAIGAIAACLMLMCSHVIAASEKVLWNFCTNKDTCNEADFTDHGPLLMDAAGNIYGTSGSGTGKYGFGTVFRLSPSGGRWHHTTLYNFSNARQLGVKPMGALIMDTAGNLYGTASEGGRLNHAGGTAFELMPPAGGGNAWKIKILYYFCAYRGCPDGATPHAGLTYAGAASGLPYDGVSPLFGTTYDGGKYGHNCIGFEGCGAAYRLSFDGAVWKEDVLYTFCSEARCQDGDGPSGELAMDGQGNLFGTTEGGGMGKCESPSCGTVFELSGNGGVWQHTALYNFCSQTSCTDGWVPQSGVIIDAAGNLFGTTSIGGAMRAGTLFKMTWDPEQQSWSHSIAYDFCAQTNCTDGAGPGALVMDADGNLFGATSSGGANSFNGTIYKFSQAGYSVLYDFCARQACKDGQTPDTRLLLDQSGNLFGTAPFGGSDNHGVVFELMP